MASVLRRVLGPHERLAAFAGHAVSCRVGRGGGILAKIMSAASRSMCSGFAVVSSDPLLGYEG